MELYRILARGHQWPRALSAVLTLAVAAYAICLEGEAIVLAIKRETLRERTAQALLLRFLPIVCGAIVPLVTGFGIAG